jgi:hypothetical protein
MRLPILLCVLCTLGACDGGGAGGTDAMPISVADAPAAAPDVAPAADAAPLPPDAVPRACFAPAMFGTSTLADAQAQGEGPPLAPDIIEFTASADASATPDLFSLGLYRGYGVFMEGIAPGTYQISGLELDLSTCGLCGRLFTDRDPVSGMPGEQQFFASGGQITITSVTPNLTGSVSNLTLVEVTVNPTTYATTPVENGCTTRIDSASFSVPVTF